MDAIISAIIGFFANIIGALIQTFSHSHKTRKKTNKYSGTLTGTWKGKWEMLFPEDKIRTIEDIIEIIEVNGKIKGEGNVLSYGRYRIMGKDSTFCIALLFNGAEEEEKENLAGACLLKKIPDKNFLIGKWIQLDKDGDLIGGDVSLTKFSCK